MPRVMPPSENGWGTVQVSARTTTPHNTSTSTPQPATTAFPWPRRTPTRRVFTPCSSRKIAAPQSTHITSGRKEPSSMWSRATALHRTIPTAVAHSVKNRPSRSSRSAAR